MTDTPKNGVGPHALPWPTGEQYDAELLQGGDDRNVTDAYRYWNIQAIKADLAKRHHSLEVAIENWQYDRNIGTIVRTANAFNAAAVHVIGKRHWNRRGAMVTDRYMTIHHHKTVQEFTSAVNGKSIVIVDNVPAAVRLHDMRLAPNCVLVFGGEGPGVSAEMQAVASGAVMIEQFGSTRSMNVGVAAGIVMYEWLRQNILD